VTVRQPPSSTANIILVFVSTKAELEAQVEKSKTSLDPKAVLWVAFRKGASKRKQDFNRDDVLICGEAAGLKSLTLISLDPDWSAFKFKIA